MYKISDNEIEKVNLKKRKYDSIFDEMGRYYNTGRIIVTKKVEKDNEVWNFVLGQIIKSFGKKLNFSKDSIFAGMKIKNYKKNNNKIEILEYNPKNTFAIEISNKRDVSKKIILKKRNKTLIKKYSRIEYSVSYKNDIKNFGISSTFNKLALKRKEDLISAQLAIKISKKFSLKKPNWAKIILEKHSKRNNILL